MAKRRWETRVHDLIFATVASTAQEGKAHAKSHECRFNGSDTVKMPDSLYERKLEKQAYKVCVAC